MRKTLMGFAVSISSHVRWCEGTRSELGERKSDDQDNARIAGTVVN
jgi:hypothetical protein